MQRMAEMLTANDDLMRRRQGESLQNAYQQRARDVAATGVKGAGRFL